MNTPCTAPPCWVLGQINPQVGALDSNAQTMLAEVRRHLAQTHNGPLACVFPELSLTGYPPEDLLLRSGFRQQVEAQVAVLQAVSADWDVLLVFGAPYWDQQGCCNAAWVLYRGAVLHRACKQYLPNEGVFDERRYFVSGGARHRCFSWAGRSWGLLICEDLWRSEPAALLAAQGMDGLISINASPYAAGKQAQRLQLLQQRAGQLACPVLYVNQVGGQDELVFDGRSMVVQPTGEVAVQAALCAEDAPLWCAQSAAQAVTGGAANTEAEYFAVIRLGLRDYVQKNGFRRVLLGLSGGVDSALCLVLAVAALGADAVQAVLLPSRHTRDISVQDAEALCQVLGCAALTLPIEPVHQALRQVLLSAHELKQPVTDQNLQARARGVLLMALANEQQALLLTTGNKSEVAVGYATLYGDMAGAYAPIKDCYKTGVYRLCDWYNKQRPQARIPDRILTRPPSAELAPEQEDADSLPPYEVLDAILYAHLELGMGKSAIAARVQRPLDEVQRILHLVRINEFKRRQAAPGPRLSDCAFGRERRYPMTHAWQDA